MITKSREDYLETIFHLQSENQAATTKAIAEHLKIAPASVSEAIQRLSKEKLASYSPYKGVALTAKGRQLALDVVRRHRLSERYLVDKLGVKWEEVHEQAHKLEHGISKIVENKMYEALGEPKTCPHGNPVPDAKGKIKETRSYPLSTFNKNNKVKIIKITDEEPKLLSYFAALGLLPGIVLKIDEKAPFEGPIMVRMGKTTYALGRKVADAIWAKKI